MGEAAQCFSLRTGDSPSSSSSSSSSSGVILHSCWSSASSSRGPLLGVLVVGGGCDCRDSGGGCTSAGDGCTSAGEASAVVVVGCGCDSGRDAEASAAFVAVGCACDSVVVVWCGCDSERDAEASAVVGGGCGCDSVWCGCDSVDDDIKAYGGSLSVGSDWLMTAFTSVGEKGEGGGGVTQVRLKKLMPVDCRILVRRWKGLQPSSAWVWSIAFQL